MDIKINFHPLKTKWAIGTLCLLALLLAQLIFFYVIAHNTNLPGRKGGPQDAFRHIYASAVVSKYTSPKLVELVTTLFESDQTSPHDIMDAHNNKIGILIGLNSKSIYKTVLSNVKRGQANTKSSGQVTWLSKEKWSGGL